MGSPRWSLCRCTNSCTTTGWSTWGCAITGATTRSKCGNNNAYCQDSELAWIDWEAGDEHLLAFVRRLTAFRREHQVFRRRRFFTGLPVITRTAGSPLPDLVWFTPDGREMTAVDWGNGFGRSVMLFVNGEGINERGHYGQRRTDSSFLLCFNAHDAVLDFVLARGDYGQKWLSVINTAEPDDNEPNPVAALATVGVPDRSLLVLERTV